MRARRGLVALVAGALVAAAMLAAFAIAISHNQSESRRSLEHQAHQRTQLVADLLDGIFGQASHQPDEVGPLSRPTVSDRTLDRVKGPTDDYTVLLDSSGRVLAHSHGFNAQAQRAVLDGWALKLLHGGDQWALGNRFPYAGGGVVNFGTEIGKGPGRRFLITGIPTKTLGAFVTNELAQVHGVQRQHQLMVDGDGIVVGSTVAGRPVGYSFHTAAQERSLHQASGVSRSSQYGVRYFDSVRLPNSTWRLIISIPVSDFFASVDGFHHALPWIILAAFAVVALVALWLLWRAIEAATRIRVTNERLSTANDELETAQAGLEQANRALARNNTELERQARELARSNTELDQFAQVASHDLQEPLRKVRTFTERITETEAGNLSERGSDYLRRANSAAERMQTLIEDLLRFSRVSTQGREFAPVDLGAVTEDVLDDLSELVQGTGARVEVGPLPTINGDATQLRQLIQNLLSNALKFRREGVEPYVRVAAGVESGWLTLTVADNGIGFEEQYRTRIFRVFERLHGRGAYPGTGIGLALCRKIAERHGGTVVAEGVLGEGATFTVTLQTERTGPVSDAPEGPTAPEGEQEPYVTV